MPLVSCGVFAYSVCPPKSENMEHLRISPLLWFVKYVLLIFVDKNRSEVFWKYEVSNSTNQLFLKFEILSGLMKSHTAPLRPTEKMSHP